MVNARYLFSRPILAVALVAGCCIWTGNALAVEVAVGNGGNHADEQLLQPRDTDRLLLDFADTDAIKQLSAPGNFKVSRGHQSVEVTGSIKGKNQSLSITSTAKPWDLSGYLYLVADVRNDGTAAMTIVCRAEDPQYAGWHHYAESVARVKAGETRSVLVFLKRKDPPAEQLRSLFPGMDALPNGYMAHWSGLDPTHICKMVMGLESTGPEFKLQLLRLRGVGICDNAALTAPGYFPFIDAYGQFLHADWPTRIRTPDDFTTQRATEAAVLHASPRPASWDQYGGYKNGPQLNASGNFRVEKYAGKWWFVDPDGRLFWSHGVTGVGFTIATPVKGRETSLPNCPSQPRANPIQSTGISPT